MLKTFVGYIDLKDVIHQIEENKKKEMKKRLHHQNFDCICEDYVFYTEKIKNVLFEYCNDVFIKNDNDLYFDMTHSQLLFDGDMNEVMKSIAFQIDSEYHIHINIAMSFHQDFAKWIYHHCQDQYRMLDYHQAQRIFGKNLCQSKMQEMKISTREILILPQLFGEDDQTVFSCYDDACCIGERLTKKLVLQLKEKDYGIRHIQIQYYDDNLKIYKEEKQLRNYTNIYNEIYYTVMQLLENISYQKTYFGLKILLSDFEDYQEKTDIFNVEKTSFLAKWISLKPHYHFLPENRFFKNTVEF